MRNKEAQNEDTSEPYYSQIIHNDNSDSGYVMKSNISYSALQMSIVTDTTINDYGNSAASGTYKPSNEIPVVSHIAAKQCQTSDYDDIIHWTEEKHE